MRAQGHASRITVKALSVQVNEHMAMGRTDLVRAEGLAPDIEEISQSVCARLRGLYVNDPVLRVRMKPVEAIARNDHRATGCAFGRSADDTDPGRDKPRIAVDVDREVGVNVVQDLLHLLAFDPIDRLTLGLPRCRGEQGRSRVVGAGRARGPRRRHRGGRQRPDHDQDAAAISSAGLRSARRLRFTGTFRTGLRACLRATV